MTTPASLSRVLGALRRLMPPKFYSSDDDSAVVAELGVIARAFAVGADLIESILPNFFLTSTAYVLLLDRFERMLSIPVRGTDSAATRIARVQAVLSRRAGYTKDKLAAVLGPLMGITAAQVVFLETLRTDFDPAMTTTITPPPGIQPPCPATLRIATPWPSTVDDTGVMLAVEVLFPAGSHFATVTLTHIDGPSVTLAGPATTSTTQTVTIADRTTFLGKRAAGPWRVDVASSVGGASLVSASLEVSPDTDARTIYNFFARRDPSLGVSTPLDLAQRAFTHTAIGHADKIVCERAAVLCDDAHSLTDREPVGS